MCIYPSRALGPGYAIPITAVVTACPSGHLPLKMRLAEVGTAVQQKA